MDRTEELACKVALKRMIDKGWVDICDIDKIGKLSGIPVGSSPAYKTLSLLHCVSFKDMPDELRQEMPRLFIECLGVNPFERPARQVHVHSESEPAPRRRLFGLIG